VRPAPRLRRAVDRHFEAGFLALAWVDASILAALVGRPWLGAIGLVTVLPFLVAYAVRCRRSGQARP